MSTPPLENAVHTLSSWTAAELSWQRALRLDAPERRTSSAPAPDPRAYERWTEFFGEEGVSPAVEALGLDSESFHPLVENTSPPEAAEPPSWVLRVDHRLAAGRSSRSPHETFLFEDTSWGLLLPVADLVRGYQRSLYEGVRGGVAGEDPRLARLPEILVSAPPVRELNQLMARTMVLELNVARVEGRLTGDTPEERYESYLRLLGESDNQRALWDEYPVMLRLADQLLAHWESSRAEFTTHLVRDLSALDTLHGEPLGPVTAVRFGAGDTHRGGRSVAITDFDGARLVHKPHPLGADTAWNAVIDWFNSHDPKHGLSTPRVLERPGHGWTTFVEHAPCPADEVPSFYWRAGALLALNHVLCGTDLHHENLIASGAHPVMVDMEALFQVAPVTESGDIDPARALLAESVLRVGLLPYKIFTQDGDTVRAMDISAVGADQEQQTFSPVPVAHAVGTDEMAFVAEHLSMPGGTDHQPHVGGEPVDPLDHADSFLEGFTTTYRLVLDDHASWTGRDGLLDRFLHVELRHIARPTATYAALLGDGSHPDFLRDGREHDRCLARVAFGTGDRPATDPLLVSEFAELRRGDVPYFVCRPNGTDLVDGLGSPIPDFLPEPPIDTVRRRVGALDEEDLERQATLVRRTFDTLLPLRPESRSDVLPLGETPLSREEATEEASRLAHELCDEAVENGPDLGWVGLTLVEDQFWQPGPLPTDLYEGISGIGLFLSLTADITEDPRVRSYAERTADATARRLLDAVQAHARATTGRTSVPASGRGGDPGAFGEIGGAIYHLAHAGVLHGRKDWLDAAEQGLPVLRSHVDHDTMHDVLSGSAGAVLAALALHAARPTSATLATAEHAAAAVVERATPMPEGSGWYAIEGHPPLSGFAHGAAGMVLALERMFAVVPRPEYRRTAEQALVYERSLLDPNIGNWPDLRPNVPEGSFGAAWCHGAPGIGLSRVGLPSSSSLSEEDIRIAERTVRSLHTPEEDTFLFHSHDGLCHGVLGNLEFLAAVATRRGDTEAHTEVLRGAATLVRRARERGWSTSPLPPAAVPGLMNGRAGIGYGLLRLAFPERVPSVLLLETP